MVGIVTFHRAHNYGAVLQCYALQEFIRQVLKREVEIVNYSCSTILNGYTDGSPKFKNQSVKSLLRSVLAFLLKGRKKRIRYNKFDKFITTSLILSPEITKVTSESLSRYTSILFGSDQIWNTDLTDNDSFYFGDMPFNGRKIGFAASAGKKESKIGSYRRYLSDYYAVGVREQSLCDKLSNIGIKSQTTVDPTLLLDSEQWTAFLNLDKHKTPKQDYVLVYPLRERKRTVRMAEKLAKELGIKVVEVGAQTTIFGHRNRKETVGPEEFINLIRNARAVVTNSFHGTVFSIIFNKDFYTVSLGDGEDGRVKNLLESVGLAERIIPLDAVVNYTTIYYEPVNRVIESIREKSVSFLSVNIK